MSDLKRKKNESFEAFMRRVKQQWQRSGKILQARKIQYFTPKQSKNVVRKLTVSKVAKNTKTDLLRKTGKLPPEDFKNKKRR
jgi:ribosomal protein S21